MAESSADNKRTPLFDEHRSLGARMVPFGGWEMSLSYSSQLEEHQAVRESVGIFDVSHMGQVSFHGPRALSFLQQAVPGDLSSLKDGESRYTQLTNQAGGVIDDLIITRLEKNHYFAVINAATTDGDFKALLARRDELQMQDVDIVNESETWAMIAVQGPLAPAVLDRLFNNSIASISPAFTMHRMNFLGVPVLLSRTGYTGEVGGEIMVPATHAVELWNRLLSDQAMPCGLAARDTLRLEAGYCLYGNDLSPTISPIEAGLAWSVSKSKKEDYPGRTVIDEQRREGPKRRLVGLKVDGRKPLRAHDQLVSDGKPAGEVTSGGYSPVLQCGIALALIDASILQNGKTIEVLGRIGNIPVSVVKPPFVETSLKAKSK